MDYEDSDLLEMLEVTKQQKKFIKFLLEHNMARIMQVGEVPPTYRVAFDTPNDFFGKDEVDNLISLFGCTDVNYYGKEKMVDGIAEIDLEYE